MNFLLESYKKVLKEYHQDQLIPFEGIYGHKTNADTFLDWIEDFGKYGTLPASKINFYDGVKSGLKVASDWAGVTESDLYHNLNYNDFGFFTKHEEDGKGNIYVERAIGLPKLSDIDTDYKNYFQLIKNYQNNVGGCWTWKKGNAMAYCSEAHGDTVTLKGYIRSEDIDWVETDYINCGWYYHNKECEVRVKPNALVEVIEIETSLKLNHDKFNRSYAGAWNKYVDGKGNIKSRNLPYNYKLPLKGSIIVHASYFGNNGKYNGEYAQIYNSQSKIKSFIGRKGNIINGAEFMKNPDNWERGTELFNITIVSCLGKYNAIDKKGRLFSPNKWYDSAFPIYYNRVRVSDDDEENPYNVINEKGRVLCQTWYSDIDYFGSYSKLSLVKLEDNTNCYNYIDLNGKVVFPIWFESLCYDMNDSSLKYSVVMTSYDGPYFLFPNGKYLDMNNCDSVGDENEGFLAVEQDGQWNVVDDIGNLISDKWFDNVYIQNMLPTYDDDYSFIVKKNGKYSIMRTNGNFLVNKWFDELDSDYYDDAWLGNINGVSYRIETNGQIEELDKDE